MTVVAPIRVDSYNSSSSCTFDTDKSPRPEAHQRSETDTVGSGKDRSGRMDESWQQRTCDINAYPPSWESKSVVRLQAERPKQDSPNTTFPKANARSCRPRSPLSARNSNYTRWQLALLISDPLYRTTSFKQPHKVYSRRSEKFNCNAHRPEHKFQAPRPRAYAQISLQRPIAHSASL